MCGVGADAMSALRSSIISSTTLGLARLIDAPDLPVDSWPDLLSAN